MKKMDEKIVLILDQIHERIDNGEWDRMLNIPFASKNLLKSLVNAKMEKRIENGNNPIFSDSDMLVCVQEVRETAAYTASVFLKIGLLNKDEDGLSITEKCNSVLGNA